MAGLETLVRPFETPDVTPIAGVASIPQLSPNVTLIVTGGGAIKSGPWSFSYSISCYADAKQNEKTQQ